MLGQNVVSFVQTGGSTTQPRKKTVRVSLSRVEQLKPIVLKEIIERFTDAEYFTRDHLLYFRCLRQFSMAYKIALVRKIVMDLIESGELIKFNKIDIGVASTKNARKQKRILRNNEVAYAGSYTTRSADELISRRSLPKLLNHETLKDWLQCISKLDDEVRTEYAKRILDDLSRRGLMAKIASTNNYKLLNDNS